MGNPKSLDANGRGDKDMMSEAIGFPPSSQPRDQKAISKEYDAGTNAVFILLVMMWVDLRYVFDSHIPFGAPEQKGRGKS